MEEKDILALIKGVVAEARKQDKEGNELEEARKRKAEGDAKPETETFNCPECGEKVSANQKYCPGCGTELQWEA
jgi:uncharacterized OB-fold protein